MEKPPLGTPWISTDREVTLQSRQPQSCSIDSLADIYVMRVNLTWWGMRNWHIIPVISFPTLSHQPCGRFYLRRNASPAEGKLLITESTWRQHRPWRNTRACCHGCALLKPFKIVNPDFSTKKRPCQRWRRTSTREHIWPQSRRLWRGVGKWAPRERTLMFVTIKDGHRGVS